MGPGVAVAEVRNAVRACLSDLAPGDLVLVACSGGADSLALAAAAAFVAPRLGLRAGDAPAIARTALDEVGLTARSDAWPLTLSGGEAQRAALARALVREPSLLLLDEPFSALDALTRISMHRLVLRLWAHHQPAVLLVTHDVDEALSLADRVLVLAGGRIAYSGRIDAPRPRDRDDPGLADLRTRLLTELGVALEVNG